MNTLLEDAQAAGASVGMTAERITLQGGKPLVGRIELKGAKNLVTKAMVAALLGETPSVVVVPTLVTSSVAFPLEPM